MMKRISGILLAVAICMTAVVPAMAQAANQQTGMVIEKTLSLQSEQRYPQEILYGTELILFHESDYVGLMDLAGNVVVPAAYLSISNDNAFDCLKAGKYNEHDEINNKGVIDKEGNVLVPFQYGDVTVLSEKWCVGFRLAQTNGEIYDYTPAYGFGDEKYIIRDCAIYNMQTKTIAGTLNRDAYFNASALGDYLIVTDRSNKNTVYNAKLEPVGHAEDSLGYTIVKNPANGKSEVRIAGVEKEIFATEGEIFTIEDNYIWITRGKMGLMDMQGSQLVPCEFDRIYGVNDGYAMVEKDGQVGLADLKGNIAVACKYDGIRESFNAYIITESYYFVAGYCPVKKDGKIGYVNLAGEETCPATIPEDGAMILACSAVISNDEGGLTLVAADGTVTQTEYMDIGRIAEDMSGRLLWACDQQGMYGIIDWHGNVVTPFEYSGSDLFQLSDLGTVLLVRSESMDMPDEVFSIKYE